MKQLLIIAICLLAPPAFAADSDTPADYTHVLPLAASARQGVLQLRLPREAYLHARSAQLHDVRVFDAKGVPQPYALRQPTVETAVGHQDVPPTFFSFTPPPISGAKPGMPT